MIDSKLLLDDAEGVARQLATKGLDPKTVWEARDALLLRRSIQGELDSARAELNESSRAMGSAIQKGERPSQELRDRTKGIKARVGALEEEARDAIEQSNSLLLRLPNLPDPEAPIGDSEDDNKVVRYVGEVVQPPVVKPHWEIADAQNWWEPERAARMSGSGFAILRGEGARLLRALVGLGMDHHRKKYTELIVPHMVLGQTMVGTGHLPKFADDAYSTIDDMWMIPTAEVPLTAFHRGEVLDPEELPQRYMAYTSAFRREAGAAGKDTRGMQRLHEFHKLELMIYARPDQVDEVFPDLLADAEWIIQALELPYRVVDLATGDLTFSSARIFDLEVYAPGVDRWLEVASIGNFSDFQARRSQIRMRTENGNVPVFTFNGSGMATPRVWAAILETGLQEDGRVRIPDVLAPYMDGAKYMGKPTF